MKMNKGEKKMKKTIMAVLVGMMIMFGASHATACGGNGSLTGLEIDGGSYVGMQGYAGKSFSVSSSESCLTQSKTLTCQNFVGAGLLTSASGAACLTRTSGPKAGHIEGTGTFEAGVEGSIYGVDFYSFSSINITAHTQGGGCH